MISNKHLFFLILFTQFGISITSLPNTIYKKAGHDGWISVLLGGVIIQILLFVYYGLYKQFPNTSFTDYTKILTSSFVGTCINVCYYIYFIFVIFQV
ncbi:GerAB/ArcD/ProY family transporter, partial [Bacillus sp. JJ664]